MLDILAFGTNLEINEDTTYTREEWEEDYWLFIYFRTDFKYFSNGEMQNGNAGQYLIYKPHERLDHGGKRVQDYFWVKGDSVDAIMEESGIPSATAFYLPNKSLICDCFQNYSKTSYYLPSNKETVLKIMTESLLLQFVREYKDSTNYIKYKKTSFDKIRRLMLDNFSQSWDIERLVKLSGYARSQFYSIYKAMYGISPIDELLKYRIHNAKIMLENTDLSIFTIALQCGFENAHTFTQAFKKQESMTPSDYRIKAKRKIN